MTAETQRSSFLVLNDAPVGEGGNEDLMDASHAATSLAELIIASRAAAPFTVAIDAAWGMGKSSMMRQLNTELAGHKGVASIWFNAWTAGSADALEGLIKSVLLKFDRNVLRRVVSSAVRLTRLFALLRIAAPIAARLLGIGRLVDDIWRAMTADAKTRNDIRGILRDGMKAWLENGRRLGEDRLLVIFVDDLDRCGDEQIVEVCEAIKVYLDVPGVVFVLACDQSVLVRAVRDAAGIEGQAAVIEYLEKIVQISYRILAPGVAEAQRLFAGYTKKSRTDGLFDEPTTNLILERTGRNPRRIKQLINSFIVEYHLNTAWRSIEVRNLVKVIILQHFYPDFYRIAADPRSDDPMPDFLSYHGIRSAIRSGKQDVSRWRRLFVDKGIQPPGIHGEASELAASLEALEEQLPVTFPEWDSDRNFVLLMESMRDVIESGELSHLLRQPLRPMVSTSYKSGIESLDMSLDDLQILWIDDEPQEETSLYDYLERHGASIAAVTDRGSAEWSLSQYQPDVVLSDLRRFGDNNAGFTDLEYFRKEGLYDGPVVFFTANVTPARQRRARELNASVTNDPLEVIRLIAPLAG